VLATYRHQAVVIDAVECVGHGVCERVCPVGAITLVIGTEKRGLEILKLTEHFETERAGLFVVGELGRDGADPQRHLAGVAGGGAHRAAAHQVQGGTDLLIVGAGPAGLAAALAARAAGLPFRIIEQGELGGSMLHYPRRKLVMTHAVTLPGWACCRSARWRRSRCSRSGTRRSPITGSPWKPTCGSSGWSGSRALRGAHVEGSGPAGRVVVALGRRGTPRRLDVPGEESAKVFYRLIEPEKFDGLRVVVAGAGSAGIEAALALAERRARRSRWSIAAPISRARARN